MTKKKRFLLSILLSVFFACAIGAFLLLGRVAADAVNRVDYIAFLKTYSIENFSADTVVYDPDGNVIESQGSFTCDKLGRYSVYKNDKLLYYVEVIYQPFAAAFEYKSDIPANVGAGETLFLPKATISTEFENFDSYSIDVLLNGTTVKTFNNVKSDVSYFFNLHGEYKIIYYVVDKYGYYLTDEHDVSASGQRSIINVSLPSFLPVLSSIDFSAVSGFYEGVFYDAYVSITDPDGLRTDLSGSLYVPKKQGEYSFEISSVVAGETITRKYKVEVGLSESSLFSNANKIQSVVAEPSSPVEIATSGVGASIYYNKIINLKEFTKNDRLIELFCNYEGEDSVHTTSIRVKLTDVNDPDNVVSVRWRREPASHDDTYMLVEFNGYALGIKNDGKDDWTGKNGEPRETYGSLVKESLYRKTNPLNFSYDYEEKTVYSVFSGKVEKILDMDDAKALGASREVFKGFSSDFVYLSIDFIDNISSVIEVQSVAGESFVSSVPEIKDDNYLRFNFDGKIITGETDVNYVGNEIEGYLNHVCKFPEPITSDILFGNIPVAFNVLKKHGNEYETVSNVSNYYFTPVETGTYKAVYTYTDKYGAISVKEFPFKVDDSTPPAIGIVGQNVVADIMSYCYLPEITTTGGVKTVKKTISLFYNDVPVQLNNDRILLDKVGEVKIHVDAVDFIGQEASEEFTITVNRDKRIITVSEEPLTFIAGREYVLPDFTAIDYSFDEGEDGYYMEKTVKVGGQVIGSDLKYTPSYNAETIVIDYFGGYGTPKQVQKSVEVRIISNGEGQSIPLYKYFDYDSVITPTLFEQGLCFDATGTGDITLPNPVPINAFSFKFALLKDMFPDTISVFLTDYNNAEQQTEITFKPVYDSSAETWIINILSNGETLSILKYSTGKYSTGAKRGTEYYSSQIKLLNNGANVYNDTDDLLCKITNYVGGRAFDGFDSGLVVVKIRIDSSSSSSFVLTGIANQSISTAAFKNNTDRVGPAIAPEYKLDARYPRSKGNIVIPKAIAFDVLQGNIKNGISLTITKPDGSTVSVDGSVSNVLALNAYGLYKFSYSAVDYSGNRTTYQNSIRVYDDERPNIVVSGEVRRDYKVGETLELPSFTATDNVAVNKSDVLLQEPTTLIVKADNEYKFEKAGKYRLIFFANDAEGNITKIIYQLNVSE